MRKMIWVLALVLLAAACSSNTSDNTETTEQLSIETTTVGDEPVATTAPPPTTSPPTTVAATVSTPFDGIETLHATAAPLTVSVEGTTRPRFSWDPVAGAERYSLVIVNTDGDSVWAWSGVETAVVVGGGEVDRTGLGARISDPSWSLVIARAADGTAIAVGDATAVGPGS